MFCKSYKCPNMVLKRYQLCHLAFIKEIKQGREYIFCVLTGIPLFIHGQLIIFTVLH